MGAPGKPKARTRAEQKAERDAESDPFLQSLEARRANARERHFELVDSRDLSQSGQRLVALAHAEVWRCEAAILQHLGKADFARKASSSANELEVLAAKLLHDSIADRVAELERRLSTTRKAAAKLAELDD